MLKRTSALLCSSNLAFSRLCPFGRILAARLIVSYATNQHHPSYCVSDQQTPSKALPVIITARWKYFLYMCISCIDAKFTGVLPHKSSRILTKDIHRSLLVAHIHLFAAGTCLRVGPLNFFRSLTVDPVENVGKFEPGAEMAKCMFRKVR